MMTVPEVVKGTRVHWSDNTACEAFESSREKIQQFVILFTVEMKNMRPWEQIKGKVLEGYNESGPQLIQPMSQRSLGEPRATLAL
jgi:hypothetical protein